MLWSTLVSPTAGSKPTRRHAGNSPRGDRGASPRPARTTPRRTGSTARDRPRDGRDPGTTVTLARTPDRNRTPPPGSAAGRRSVRDPCRQGRSRAPRRTRKPPHPPGRAPPNSRPTRRPPEAANARPRHAGAPLPKSDSGEQHPCPAGPERAAPGGRVPVVPAPGIPAPRANTATFRLPRPSSPGSG